MANQIEKNLALAIASCSDVCIAIGDKKHPCHKVVSWQAQQFQPVITEVIWSQLHRPEPWTGDLATAKIVFLASNPSFDPNENFPNWNEKEWSDEDVSRFGAERFTSDIDRKFGAIDSPDPSLRDRTIWRSGNLSKEVKHWKWVRQFAAFTLGKEVSQTSAITDYVMTELVHCKSPHEEGVVQAVSQCTLKWFEQIMAISPANIIFIAGAKSAEAFVEMYGDRIPNNWGSWGNSRFGKGNGLWPRTENDLHNLVKSGNWTPEVQKANMCTVEISGRPRLVIYIARPGGGGGINSPWNHLDLVHPDILKIWREQLQ